MRLSLRLFSVRQLPDGLLFALLCLALAGAGSVSAATLVVTTTADNEAGSSVLSSPPPRMGTTSNLMPHSMGRSSA